MVAMDLWQAAAAPHSGPTVTEWILAFAAAVVSPFVTLFVMHRQNANTLKIAQQQTETALKLARQQNETALRVARQQVLADVVSASRRRWIELLRDGIAEFQAAAMRIAGVTHASGSPSMKLPMQSPSEIVQTIERLSHLYLKLRLLLNPVEEDHVRLGAHASEALAAAATTPPDMKALSQANTKMVEIAQRVLKREWERVKTEPTEW